MFVSLAVVQPLDAAIAKQTCEQRSSAVHSVMFMIASVEVPLMYQQRRRPMPC